MAPREESADPDAVLLRAGESALGKLLERQRSYLTLVARASLSRLLQAKIDSDDLVQETFLRAYQEYSTFRGSTVKEFRAWLRQILRSCLGRVVRQFLGTQGRDPRWEQPLAEQQTTSSASEAGAIVATDSTPSKKVVHQEQAVKLAEALDRLPEHYREVILLHHVEGMPLSAVAVRLNRTEDSVQKLWARALLQLRVLLRDPP